MDARRSACLRGLFLVSFGGSLVTLAPRTRAPQGLESAVNVTHAALEVSTSVEIQRAPPEPLAIPPQPLAPSVQNHIYKMESALGDPSQEAFRLDQELLKSGWDARRYPWRMIQQRQAGKAILYGTAKAQQMIWDHQHPKGSLNRFDTFLEFTTLNI